MTGLMIETELLRLEVTKKFDEMGSNATASGSVTPPITPIALCALTLTKLTLFAAALAMAATWVIGLMAMAPGL